MRLANIKLAGFKSFVDPTTIGTPGQLVGIVGPNGCGKSNVIDAVRWVLGESKASALRGESMQDVIFNGAGERKPVGRASVELHFNNDHGRIGGQWGQYAEISIKRVLSRDGDSSYYINNIPVRRRDIHDLFLGTGLGPRAYAIIEQGMISRVIEAKPEELRVFLEEAAGVSKYKERRKETESRIKDTRENLSRVEDIRSELSQQLEKLEGQARIATEYRDLEARLKHVQHLLWFSKQQDAMRARERHTAEVANLVNALESIQAEVRSVEAKLEHMRSDHYAANDALHQTQGGFYAANAEVSRLEQQLAFARENETRLTQQVAQITDQTGAFAQQERSLAADRVAAEQALDECVATRQQMTLEEQQAASALPALDEAVRAAAGIATELQQQASLAEQSIRVLETKRDHLQRASVYLSERRERLQVELSGLSAPAIEEITAADAQFAHEETELARNQSALDALRDSVQELQQTRRVAGDAAQNASRMLADLEARAHALAALQARIGRGRDDGQWLEQHGLGEAQRLFSALDVDPDWNDALEAVLRESMEAIELPALLGAIPWLQEDAGLPGRVAVYSSERNSVAFALEASTDALLSKVRTTRPETARLLADWLRGVRCAADLRDAVDRRQELGIGEAFVTPQGHLVSAQAINFFAPDNELHGVLARQRELVELDQALIGARSAAAAARAHQAQVDVDLDARQRDYHAQGVSVSSQQRRCHDLDIVRMQLRQATEAAEHRRTQIAQELADLASQEGVERQQSTLLATEIEAAEAEVGDLRARRADAHHARNEMDVELARGRESLRVAERAAQEAAFAERSCRDRLSELGRRRDALSTQLAQQQHLLARLEAERAGIDLAPIEQNLQQQLAARAGAEQALSLARDTLEGVSAQLRAFEEARLAAEQRLDPARTRIEEMRLKEQAASMLERQFTEQLGEAHAEWAELPEGLKSFGNKSGLPVEIERVQTAIAGLGAVNLAALTEVSIAQERKQYLDAQSADLTEAMATLEHAIKQIDRESRQLLQQTFDTVNENFARLFPALFGGGQAQLVLTGEEILDSGVQVVAQPPGKRNTSIHLLSGGEKALTAISLVFALFQINPAPFCLLDEVDAPLDDPNTDRFCKLVQQMSAETQFLFISHNKITMEMASQLVGITMPEPGISRVVAVDIEEALELAETGVA